MLVMALMLLFPANGPLGLLATTRAQIISPIGRAAPEETEIPMTESFRITPVERLRAIPEQSGRENAPVPLVVMPDDSEAAPPSPSARPGADAAAPAPRPPEPPKRRKPPQLTAAQKRELEVTQANALVAFNAGKYADAEKLFRKVLALDWSYYVALEYIARIDTARGSYEDALRIYENVKRIEPPQRIALIDFHIGNLYAQHEEYSMAEEYFRRAAEGGAFPVHSRYYLALILRRQQLWLEAEEWLHETERELARSGHTRDEELLAQPIHYYLGESYARFGFPRYALPELAEGARGKSEELRKAAWAVEDLLDRHSAKLVIGAFGQLDSDVLGLADSSGYPPTYRSNPGAAGALLGDFSARTTPARRWGFGGELLSFTNHHPTGGLSSLDLWTNAPNLWVSWWNLRDTEVKLRYDYSSTMLNRDWWKLYLQTQGPRISASWFPDHRHQLDASYSFKRNFYPRDPAAGDDVRSGSEHVISGMGSIWAPNPALQPFAQYIFDDVQAQGRNFTSYTNTLELGLAYWIEGFARPTASVSYGYGYFPDNDDNRRDGIFQARLAVSIPVSRSLLANVDASYLRDSSTVASVYSYARLLISSGFTYTLPF